MLERKVALHGLKLRSKYCMFIIDELKSCMIGRSQVNPRLGCHHFAANDSLIFVKCAYQSVKVNNVNQKLIFGAESKN